MTQSLTEEARPATTPWGVGDIVMGGLAGTVLSALLLVVLFAGLGLRDRLSPNTFVAVVGIVVYAAIFVCMWYFTLKRRKATWADAGFKPVPPRALLTMIPVAVGVMFLNATIVLVTRSVLGDVPTAQDQLLADRFEMTTGDFVWLLLLGSAAAPLVEEFVFRGLIFRYLRFRRGTATAVIGSAVVFAFAHFIMQLLLVFFAIGAVLALVADRYRSLQPSIALHALHNGISILVLYGAVGT